MSSYSCTNIKFWYTHRKYENEQIACRGGLRNGYKGIDLALYFGVIVATIFISSYAVQRRVASGMYAIDTAIKCSRQHATDKPPFISMGWWIVAVIVDQTALIMAVFGSFLILYESDDAVRIILGVVAMWFIVELKWILVSKKDIALMKKWFWFNFTIYVPDSYLMQKIDYVYEPNECVKFCLCVQRLYVWIAYVIIVCISMAAPVWMVACY